MHKHRYKHTIISREIMHNHHCPG